MAKEFNLIIPANASYDEVVDTIADVFGVAKAVSDALQDGFQFNDLLVALQQEPVVREVVNDFPIFWAEFKQLNPTTAKAALLEASNRVGDAGKVGSLVFDFLFEVAETYGFIERTATDGVTRYNAWRTLLSGPQEA